MGRLLVLLKLSVLSALILSGCSLPYIGSYGDTLTPEEYFTLALAYEQNNNYEAAARAYKAASTEVAEAHYYLGNICFVQHEYQSAEKHYKIAIEKLPQDPRAYNNLAWLYFMKRNNLEQAEWLALRGLELAPKENEAPYRDTVDKIRAELKKKERVKK
jgi:tetratricopeptide (TPR) repeat protein